MDATLPRDDDTWTVAGRHFRSRLIVGTGRYKDLEETGAAIAASGAEIVTVAVRRVNLSDPKAPMLQDHVDPKKYTYLPNTAGCHTASEAVRTLRLAREAGGWNLVKLEVLGPPPTLYPDMPGTLEAAEALIKDGFEVMVYTADDPGGLQAARGHGLRGDHAAGRTDRLGTGHPERGDDLDDPPADQGSVPGGCRRGHRVRRGDRDGTGLRRRAAELGDRARQGSDPDGEGDEAGDRGGPSGVSSRAACRGGWAPIRPAR